MKKRFFTLAFTLLCVAGAWAYDFKVDGICYEIGNNPYKKEVHVTYEQYQGYWGYSPAYISLSGDITIPSSVSYEGQNYSVTSIGSNAFWGCSALTSVTIPNSVTSIGSSAFHNCSALADVYYADSMANWCQIEFGDYSNPLSNGAKLYINNQLVTDLVIPNEVTTIKNYVFNGCSSLTSVTIPDNVTSIGYSAFSDCSALTSITISNNVTNIKDNAFSLCSALTDVHYNGSVADWCQIEFPNSLSNPLSNGANFYSNNQLITDLVIPNEVTTIKNYAFYGCSSLASVTIPNSVTSIGFSAFSNCSALTSVTIPNSVTSIGYEAFAMCSALTSVTIPNSVTSIGESAFSGCSALTSVTIPNSVTNIERETFSGCTSLTSVTIPNSVTSIGNDAFRYCSSLTSVIIPNSVTSIGYSAFSDCSALSHIHCDATTPPTLGGDIGTSFQLVFVPTGTATAYANAWGNKYTYIDSETEVTVHVETAGQLTAAIIAQGATPARVTKLTVTGTLNEADFNIIKNSMPILYSLDLSSISNTTLPNEAFSQKRTFLSIALPNGLTKIPNEAFTNCKFTSITIPSSVTNIGNDAFSYCSSLTSVTIPNSVTSIGYSAFSDCSAITSVTIPNSVTSIRDRAFYGCSSLASVTIPNSVTRIENSAFSYCSSLTSVSIPISVTSIGNDAFSDCSALISVIIPNSVTSIGNDAFYRCSSLTSVTITNSVASIGDYAFGYCSGLTSITIPNSVTSIGNYAFYGCSALTSVTIGNKVQNIDSNTFSNCSQLDTITCLGSVPPTVDSNFETIDPNTCKLYVPNNALTDYASAPAWSAFLHMEGIDVNYQLTLQINEGGKVSCNNHDYTDTTELTFAAGTEVNLKLMPDAGYSVSEALVNGEDYTNQLTEDLTLHLTLKSDAIVSVSFKSEEYVITFVNDDGTILQSEQLEYGEMPIYNGATPTKEATAEYEYEFIGWSPEITIVTGDARYTATYKEVQLSAYNTATSSCLRAWQADGTLFVEVDDAVEAVMVYDVTGRLMQEYQHNGGYQMLNLPAPNKVNLVKVVSKDGSVNTHKLM